MLNTEPSGISQEIVSYNLTAPASDETIEVCLIPQNLCGVKLLGRFVTDGAFKAVHSELEITATSLDDEIVLKEVQAYDRLSEPTIKEICVAVKSDVNQIDQGTDCDIVVKTCNRKGESVTSTIKGYFDEVSKTWIYPINEKLTFDKSLYYNLLGLISVDVQVVYA